MSGILFESEHGGLLEGLHQLLRQLTGFRLRLQRGEVAHFQHDLFAERAASLVLFIDAAVRLAAEDLYAPAFALLRSALEHQALDRLYFLSARYKVVFRDVSEQQLAEWREQGSRGEPGTQDIISIERVGKSVEVIRSGPHFTGGPRGVDAPSLSRYYAVLDDFDPFEPPARLQPHLVGDFVSTIEDRKARAARHRKRWNEDLAWRRLLDNLALNGFYTEPELVRWDLHHGFLSAFVHPTPRVLEAIYGRNLPRQAPRYDHYASELVLLYAHTFARLELEALKAMTTREPSVGLVGWDDIASDITTSGVMTQHMWFPSGDPPMFDRVEEANRRGVVDRHLIPMSERIHPGDIAAAQVRYYKNPLKRLILMHAGINELSGFAWQSPWPRQDALVRSLDV